MGAPPLPEVATWEQYIIFPQSMSEEQLSPGLAQMHELTIAPNTLTTVSFAFEGDKLVLRH